MSWCHDANDLHPCHVVRKTTSSWLFLPISQCILVLTQSQFCSIPFHSQFLSDKLSSPPDPALRWAQSKAGRCKRMPRRTVQATGEDRRAQELPCHDLSGCQYSAATMSEGKVDSAGRICGGLSVFVEMRKKER